MLVMAGELPGKIAGEAVWRLNDDGLGAVGDDAVDHLGEARPLGDGIGAGDGDLAEAGIHKNLAKGRTSSPNATPYGPWYCFHSRPYSALNASNTDKL